MRIIGIKTKRLNCYPGDKSTQVSVVYDNGQTEGIHNVERKHSRNGNYYESDRYSMPEHETIKQVKMWTLQVIGNDPTYKKYL